MLNSELIGLGRGCQEQCFRSGSIEALFVPTIQPCFRRQREGGRGLKARLCSQCEGRLKALPCPGQPGRWSGPSSRREGKSKRQTGTRKGSGRTPSNAACCLSPVRSNSCLRFSKTDRKAAWNVVTCSSGSQPIPQSSCPNYLLMSGEPSGDFNILPKNFTL